MEKLSKQRVRFPGFGEEADDDNYSIRAGRLPPQKKVSFNKEKKKTQNWLQRQFSGQMSEVEDANDGEFETAIAAAAYAIMVHEEESSLNQKKSVEETRSPLTKSKREESLKKPSDGSKISRWFSGKEAEEDRKFSDSGSSSIRKSDQRLREDYSADDKVAGKEMHTIPTIKKTPTSSDKYVNMTASKRSERRQTQVGQQAALTIKPTAQTDGGGKTTNSTTAETKADAWEKAKLAKIRKRYEKMNATILEWEEEKKMKAKRRLERTKKESENRQQRAEQEFKNEMSTINQIVDGAKALAEVRKRKDEYKAMEKANKMRSTGKVSHACPCLR